MLYKKYLGFAEKVLWVRLGVSRDVPCNVRKESGGMGNLEETVGRIIP